ncbi:MAG: transposase [Phycisphaerae bacterium]
MPFTRLPPPRPAHSPPQTAGFPRFLTAGNIHRYPALRRRAKRENAEIYWEDEAGLRSDHLTGRSYAPRGATPVIRSTGNRFGCNIISAVNNLGKMRFRVFRGSFTQSVMIDFLERLIRDAKRKVIVIADGHPAHKGCLLKQWLREHASQCEVVLLPGYAPELNPDELLNQDLLLRNRISAHITMRHINAQTLCCTYL